jgi:hypothetical protein
MKNTLAYRECEVLQSDEKGSLAEENLVEGNLE